MKKQNLRLALAQINCTVGDLAGNCNKMLAFVRQAEERGADIVSFPELSITGYPPEDLLHKPKFIADNLSALQDFAASIQKIPVIAGFVDRDKSGIYNAAAVINSGKVIGVYRKMLLPNYGVFDEKRYFTAGRRPLVFKLGSVIFGVNICEDIWHKEGPVRSQAKIGAKLIFNINASPYHAGKIKEREEIARGQAKASKVYVVYNNLVGGQDELVFDGSSMVISDKGTVIGRAASFKEDLLVLDLAIPVKRAASNKKITVVKKAIASGDKPIIEAGNNLPLEYVPEIYQALVLGLKDYVEKNGFRKVVIGLSGGIDSALVAVLAIDALGEENVTGIFMPSRYSSEDSRVDAVKLSENLGIRLIHLSIEQIYKMYLMVFEQHFAGAQKDITEENLQARIRGNCLMAFSNKFGWLVLTTGNKSEMSTGYATLYGDMAGGFAVIKDVPKVLVYKLAKYRNTAGPAIPERIITKEPTAELKPNQKDRDSLPPYEILDPVLKEYIEEDRDLESIASQGFEKDVVKRTINLVDKSEYKRRQAPPGIKITPKAFGRDRRMPITNKYKG